MFVLQPLSVLWRLDYLVKLAEWWKARWRAWYVVPTRSYTCVPSAADIMMLLTVGDGTAKWRQDAGEDAVHDGYRDAFSRTSSSDFHLSPASGRVKPRSHHMNWTGILKSELVQTNGDVHNRVPFTHPLLISLPFRLFRFVFGSVPKNSSCGFGSALSSPLPPIYLLFIIRVYTKSMTDKHTVRTMKTALNTNTR